MPVKISSFAGINRIEQLHKLDQIASMPDECLQGYTLFHEMLN
jgi:hypothetical protein